MAAFAAFLMRNWQAVLGGVAVLVLAILLAVRTDQRDDARAGWKAEKQASALFAERVRTKSLEIQRKALERARRVEGAQNRISEEVSRDYQTRIAELRRRYDDLLRRQPARGANPGGGGNSLPAPGSTPGGTDAAPGDPRLSLEERYIASETAERLIALQEWVRRQVMVAPAGTGDPQ